MPDFPPNTYLLQYQDGAYVCNGEHRVEAPLNLDTLKEAVCKCPKLQQVDLDDAPFGDECFPILAQIPKLNMLALLRGKHITGHGLELLKEHPIKHLFLQRTALDDEGPAGGQLAFAGVLKGHMQILIWLLGNRSQRVSFGAMLKMGSSYYRYMLRQIGDKWMIGNSQQCQQGKWGFCGL